MDHFHSSVGNWLVAALMGFIVAASSAVAKVVTLTFNGEYVLTFDTERISEAEIRRVIFISPQLEGHDVSVAPAIEQCRTGDPQYFRCGSRDLHDPHFFHNALVNLGIATKRLAYLEALKYPKELEPVVQYEKNFLSFTRWLEQTRYDFYQTWDTEVLKRKYDDLDPSVLCASEIAEIDHATSRDQKYKLVRYGWHNCLNDAFLKLSGWYPDGGYPRKAWERFLTAYGITERFAGPD